MSNKKLSSSSYFNIKNAFTILVTAFFFLPGKAQVEDGRTGNWISTDKDLLVYFRVSGDSISGYKADFNVPEQRVMGRKCKSIKIWDDSIVIELVIDPATIRGRFILEKDSISGTWSQQGNTQPFNLKRMKRQQTPKPPFNYRADSVEYDNVDKTVHLGATLTRPSAEGKYPVAILITGSGQQDRDETIFEHRPFAIIADYLTRKGIAVLRVDDRNIGKSKGELRKATTSDFADDVLTSIAYLKTRKDIDTTQVGLIGHSEGGLIAPIVYTRWPHLKFIIMLAGPGIPGWEIVLRQQTDPVKKLYPSAFQNYYDFIKEKMKILNDDYGKPDSVTMKDLKASYINWKKSLPDSIAVMLHANTATPEMYAMQETTELIPWLRYFYKTDPKDYLRNVICPVLAINGSKDQQVYANENIPAIKAGLSEAGNKNVTTQIMPGLNHLFQHTNTGDFSEYALIDESFAPEVLKLMGDWLLKVVRLPVHAKK
jgi:pimeloyl-ACP methyl ester carboxylesterase